VHWAERLAGDLRTIRAGDAYGLDHLLQAFGGMGSINDLVIHPVNGHRVDESDFRGVYGDHAASFAQHSAASMIRSQTGSFTW
jgi:hypothetical protein